MTTESGMWSFMAIERSHFSAKLRPALRYKQLHYTEVPPDFEGIVAKTGMNLVPVLIGSDGRWLQDTTDIIDTVDVMYPEHQLVPDTPTGEALCRLFEVYADEFFHIVSIRTRYTHEENRAEIPRAFAAFSGSVEIGNAFAEGINGYLPLLGITESTIPAIDAHLDALLPALCAHFREQPFLLGDRMSLADCALMGPLYGHLYLDRVTRKRLLSDAIEVSMWIERCNHPQPEKMGSWQLDTLAPTLRAILDLVVSDGLPPMLDMEQAFEDQLGSNAVAGYEPPRLEGTYESSLRGAAYSAMIRAYTVWKLQRLRAAVPGDLPEALADLGLEAALDGPKKSTAMVKDGYRLVVA